jgi:hypothetical protein
MSIVVEMTSIGRPRQYVSAARLYAMFPVLRFSYERGAYVLRFVGETRGPVLRKNQRRRQREFTGPDRRAGAVDVSLALRPTGSVRRIEVAEAAPRRDGEGAAAATTGAGKTTRRRPEAAEANRRRRQHGRQRPPRPHR